MDIFFGRRYAEEPFPIFSAMHLTILLIVISVNVIMAFVFKKTSGKKISAFFRFGLAFFLIALYIMFSAWSVYVGDWSIDYALPFHICDAAILLTAAMLLTRNRLVFETAYFWVLGGCTQALLTPDVGFDFPHFMFFYFFVGHGIVVTAVLYMIFSERFRPYWSSILRVFILTNIYMGFVAVINVLTGGNYMFLCHKPENASIMDYMGPWPWYIAVLEFIALIVFLVCYLPYVIGDLISGKKSSYFGKIHRDMNM